MTSLSQPPAKAAGSGFPDRGSPPLLAWHFIAGDKTLRFKHNGKKLAKVRKGQRLTVDPPLTMCSRGLHASVRPLDALQYSPETALLAICRVELSGEIIHESDKVCAQHRRVIALADCTKTMHEFACWCAEQALEGERKAGCEPDKRLWRAVEVKRLWLRGKASDDELAAARAAARAAAWAAAWDAARAAARAAARDALAPTVARLQDSAVVLVQRMCAVREVAA